MDRAYKELTPFGKEVAKALVDRDMTKKELAGILGIAPQSLSRILNGTRSGKRYIPAIIAALDMEPGATRQTSAA